MDLKDFSFQGKIFLATRLASGKPGAALWVDDSSQLQLKVSVEKDERNESWSGQRLTSVSMEKGKKVEFSLTLNAFSAVNAATALSSTPVSVTSGTVTGEALPAGLAVNDYVMLDHRDITSLALTDSNGTPATLTLGTHYRVENPASGLIQILNLGAFTQPFKGAYSYAASVRLPMFTVAAPIEKYIIFDGINTVDGKRVRGGFYRAKFDPVSTLDLINDGLSSLPLTGTILFDSTNAIDSNFGPFGYLELPGA